MTYALILKQFERRLTISILIAYKWPKSNETVAGFLLVYEITELKNVIYESTLGYLR
jgi:hypothetical protein